VVGDLLAGSAALTGQPNPIPRTPSAASTRSIIAADLGFVCLLAGLRWGVRPQAIASPMRVLVWAGNYIEKGSPLIRIEPLNGTGRTTICSAKQPFFASRTICRTFSDSSSDSTSRCVSTSLHPLSMVPLMTEPVRYQ
jgi:hypothetical protein